MKKSIVILFSLFSCVTVFSQGLILDKEKFKQAEQWVAPKKLGFSASDLPLSISYRNYCPTPKSQGKVSTCVGWAVAYGALYCNGYYKSYRKMGAHI